MSNYKEQLQQNNNELNTILETVNSLPEAGSGGGDADSLFGTVKQLVEGWVGEERPHIIIPEGITKIRTDCFYNIMPKIMELPTSLTSIGACGLWGGASYGVSFVACKSTTPPIIESNSLNPDYVMVFVPDGSLNAYSEATNWSELTLLPLSEFDNFVNNL